MSAFVLVGPTASGKTVVANELARRTGALVLSADSMLVYRGMDVGTAKPPPAELSGIDFRGANLAEPCEEFSAGKWLETARAVFDEAERTRRSVIVAGGTGLYVNALIRGLDSPAPQDPVLRAELETMTAPELAARAEALSPGSVATLADPQNPRRLIRLIERFSTGSIRSTGSISSTATVAGLDAPPELLASRILARVEKMFADGLVDEAARLRREYPEFSRTAGNGIGYAEALAVLNGSTSVADAIAQTALRTRQLAKRQRTWFRRQLNVKWVASPAGNSDIPRAATEVQKIWDEHGKTELNFNK